MLVSGESLVDVLSEQVAVAKGGPRGATIWFVSDQLSVVFDGLLVVASSCTELSHFTEVWDRGNILLVLLDLRLVHL